MRLMPFVLHSYNRGYNCVYDCAIICLEITFTAFSQQVQDNRRKSRTEDKVCSSNASLCRALACMHHSRPALPRSCWRIQIATVAMQCSHMRECSSVGTAQETDRRRPYACRFTATRRCQAWRHRRGRIPPSTTTTEHRNCYRNMLSSRTS